MPTSNDQQLLAKILENQNKLLRHYLALAPSLDGLTLEKSTAPAQEQQGKRAKETNSTSLMP